MADPDLQIRAVGGGGGGALPGNRSSRLKVISPEVISPGTRVMSPEIHSHVARNFIECINVKKSNILSKSQGINS